MTNKPKQIEKIELFRFVDTNPANEPYDSDYATGEGLLNVMVKINELTEAINYLLKKVK